jgi:hypothetical protein
MSTTVMRELRVRHEYRNFTVLFNGPIVHPPDDIGWRNVDRGKPQNSEENLSQYHSDHHKPHMDWSGRKLGIPYWKDGD